MQYTVYLMTLGEKCESSGLAVTDLKRYYDVKITVEHKNSLNITINNHEIFNVSDYKIYNTSYAVYILTIQFDLFKFGMNAPQQRFNLQITHIILN